MGIASLDCCLKIGVLGSGSVTPLSIWRPCQVGKFHHGVIMGTTEWSTITDADYTAQNSLSATPLDVALIFAIIRSFTPGTGNCWMLHFQKFWSMSLARMTYILWLGFIHQAITFVSILVENHLCLISHNMYNPSSPNQLKLITRTYLELIEIGCLSPLVSRRHPISIDSSSVLMVFSYWSIILTKISADIRRSELLSGEPYFFPLQSKQIQSP